MAALRLPKERRVEMPAGLFKRLIALLIDLVVIDLIILSPFKPIVQGAIPAGGIMAASQFLSNNPGVMNRLIIISAAIGILSLAYFSILEFLVGQTVGKLALGLFAVSNTKRLSLWQALIRNAFAIPLFPFVLFWILDPLAMLFSRRGILEALSRTKTIEMVRVA